MDGDALITIDPEIQGGTPCFAGTWVPVRSLFDAIKHGRTIDYFLAQFPTVRPEQARAVLDRASADSGRGASAVESGELELPD